MKEIWKPIKGFAGYQVSNFGRVRTYNKVTYTAHHGARHWRNRILAQKLRKDNCLQVNLWHNGKPITYYVHRLVAEAFLGEASSDMTVNHKDGNRQNNHVDNLEWLSRTDNIRHGFDNDFYSTQKCCELINMDGKTYYFQSLSKASKFLNRNVGYISGVLKKGGKITDVLGNEYTVIIHD